MLIALCLSVLLQLPPSQGPKAVTSHSADPALTAKAPCAPGYGLQMTTSTGKYLLTNLSHHPLTHRVSARTYRIGGNAGLGPYRLGLELSVDPAGSWWPGVDGAPPKFDYFRIDKALDGFPVKKSGLDNSHDTRLFVLSVDGSNFGGDLQALLFHASNVPEVTITAYKPKAFGGRNVKTFRVQTRLETVQLAPGDGVLLDASSTPEIESWLADDQTRRNLLILRSRQERFAPLPIDLDGLRMWVVRALQDYGTARPSASSTALEFWIEDPLTGPAGNGLIDVWPEPEGGLQPGHVFRIKERWFRLQALAQDAASGRLEVFAFRPWEADVPALLGGGTLAKELGAVPEPDFRESLELAANSALVVWKTRSLPIRLSSQGLDSTEELVIRLEQGVLALDLEVKGIHSRLDAAARSIAERKAQAELAAKGGPSLAAVQPAQTSESERLADLLEQRKAILMAILGSAKQSLANLRR